MVLNFGGFRNPWFLLIWMSFRDGGVSLGDLGGGVVVASRFVSRHWLKNVTCAIHKIVMLENAFEVIMC